MRGLGPTSLRPQSTGPATPPGTDWARRTAELRPQRVFDVPTRPARGLPLGHQVAHGRRGFLPIGGRRELLGTHHKLLLDGARGTALGVQLREVLPPTLAEGVAGSRESLPQRIVRTAVDAANRLPLVDDGAEPIPGHLPRR